MTGSCEAPTSDPYGIYGFSNESDTRDTDLQQANLEQSDTTQRAQNLADHFQMSFDNALQVTELADKMNQLTASGQMTDEDRAAISDAALNLAGVTGAEVNAAVSDILTSKDETKMNALMDQAAAHLGMASSAGLRDEILPALGMHL
jgi:hypothetical protein